MVAANSFLPLYLAALAAASPLSPRRVQELNEEAFQEAQQRDDTARRLMSNTEIKTADGRCLFVDILSGDFRANLTPIQIAECGSTDGQGWDIITSGLHNNDDGQVLIVSTLSQACANFDPRRLAGDQVNLFSCGGRADGGGGVTDSQLFDLEGGANSFTLTPLNSNGQQCLTTRGDAVGIARCAEGDQNQSFALGGEAQPPVDGGDVDPTTTSTQTPDEDIPPVTTSVPVGAAPGSVTTAPPLGIPTTNPREAVPVSLAGGVLVPEAAEEAHQFDSSATRAMESISIRAPDGRCLSVDPTAGDFRQNLIPVAMAECNETPNQKWDIVTEGIHNNGDEGMALLVNVLVNGCISFDPRREAGDEVTLFSCGGRAAGEGETDQAQLIPFNGTNKIALKPASGNGQSCLVAGDERLVSGDCGGNDEVFDLVAVI